MKTPVKEQCSSAGLTKCDELADGLVKYVEGDKAGGEGKLRVVVKANSPDKIRTLTAALKPATKVLGSEQQAAVDGVIDILEGREPSEPGGTSAARASEAASKAAGPGPGPAETKARVRTGMARPASDARAAPCEPGPIAGDQGGGCRKVRALIGPLNVTNLYASGGCPDELVAFAGPAENPRWAIGVLPNAPLSLTGSFAVEEAEEFSVGVRSTSKEAPKADSRCAIVWSGVRPD